MIITIILAITSGALLALAQILLENNKRKKLDKAWDSCNCKIEKIITELEQLSNKKKREFDILLSKKYYEDFSLIDTNTKKYDNIYFLNNNKSFEKYQGTFRSRAIILK